MAAKTMSYRVDGRLLVVVHGAASPTEFEWASYLNHVRELSYKPELRVAVFSHGGGPDGKQRKLLTDLHGEHKHQNAPAALLTSSPIIRGVGAVLSWFVRSMKVFGLDADAEAFVFLGLSPEEAERVRTIRAELEGELRIAATPVANG